MLRLGRGQIEPALVGIAVAGDQRRALGACVEPDAAQDAPHAVLGDSQAAPLLAGELGADSARPVAGVEFPRFCGVLRTCGASAAGRMDCDAEDEAAVSGAVPA